MWLKYETLRQKLRKMLDALKIANSFLAFVIGDIESPPIKNLSQFSFDPESIRPRPHEDLNGLEDFT